MSRCLALFALVLLVPSCSDDGASVDPRFESLATAVRGDIDRNAATAASVAVWLDGEVLWVGGFGEPLDEDTMFAIGSDTKKITAIALLRAIAAGKATLETKVEDVLPDLHMQVGPAFAHATIRQLLSHQGGIIDGIEATTQTTDAALATYSYGEFASTYGSMVPPGTFWNYSNPNFSIAGLMNQQLDGRPWADIVEDDVFAPLGMARTVARRDEVDDNAVAGNGHAVGTNDADPIHRIAVADNWESAFVRPAGLVWSTPSDQIRLARFLVEGDPAVIDSALLHEVTSPQVVMYPDLPYAYGFGLMIGRGVQLGTNWYDVPVWTHGGNTRSYTSSFYVLPDQRFAISILSNGVDDDFSASVVTAISTLVDLPAAGTAPTPPFDASALDGLTGTYEDTSDGTMVIVTRAGNALNIEIPAADEQGLSYEHAMVATSTHVWNATVDGVVLDFAFIDGPTGEKYMRNRDAVLVRTSGVTSRRTNRRTKSLLLRRR
jgi:CubicO group peptidase (beta-lactamase class C family)